MSYWMTTMAITDPDPKNSLLFYSYTSSVYCTSNSDVRPKASMPNLNDVLVAS